MGYDPYNYAYIYIHLYLELHPQAFYQHKWHNRDMMVNDGDLKNKDI